jgi:microcompartment protein CcmK/EutM
MILGEVIGSVVSTRKDDSLVGLKLLIVQELGVDCVPTGSVVVAADAVGAGVHELVLCASGSSARLTDMTKDRPVDTVIMAIVDSFEIDGVWRYKKLEGAVGATSGPGA